jgi:uncharacterized protein VirK/YbjX
VTIEGPNRAAPSSDPEAAAEMPSFWGFLSRLAKARYRWPLARIVHVLSCLAVSIPRQVEVFRLLRMPAYAGLGRLNPKLPFKYLTDNYLFHTASGSVEKRSALYLHHYRRLLAAFSTEFLYRMLRRDVTLFECREAEHIFQAKMGLSKQDDQEGEMSLYFFVDNVMVYLFSFAIVPGGSFGSTSGEAILIGKMQGGKGCAEPISMATKAMHHVDPKALLLAVLEGFAVALGIREAAGVSAERQICYAEEYEATFRNAYDDFFLEIGAARNAEGFFPISLPIPKRPIEEIKSKRRAQVRRQREFESRVSADVCEFFRGHLRFPALAPTPEAEVEKRTERLAPAYY